MELNWKEDNNLVRKIAKILLGDTLPNGEPVSSLVLIDTASRAELQRWADMSDAEFEAARQSGDTIHIDIPNASITLEVSDDVLAERKARYVAPEPNIKTGWLSRYARMVTSANLGAVLK